MTSKKNTFFGLLILISVSFMSCDSSSTNGSETQSTYYETKMTLEDQEKNNPTAFLSTDGTYRKNLEGEWVLEGTITNSATIASYKDVVLRVNFYSKTETFLGYENHVLYEYFTAGNAKSFKIKTYGYKGAKSIGWDIEGASPVN